MLGIIVLIILWVYYRIAKYVYKRLSEKMKKSTALLITIVVFLLIPYWDYIPNRIYFYNLCEREAGQRIYKTVNAKGYYDESYSSGCGSTCIQLLSNLSDFNDDNYIFIQTYIRNTTSKGLSPTKGYYQFSIEDKGSPLCRLFEQHYKVAKYRYRYLPSGKCVGSQKLDKPTAKYEYVDDLDKDYAPLANVGLSYSLIKEKESNEVVARAYRFYYYGGWISRLISPLKYKITNHLSCDKENIYYPYKSFFRDIISDTFI